MTQRHSADRRRLTDVLAALEADDPDCALARGVIAALGQASGGASIPGGGWVAFPDSACVWFRYKERWNSGGEGENIRWLREHPWLPARDGSRKTPGELFSPQLHSLLGDEFNYVHPDVVTNLPEEIVERAFDLLHVTRSPMPDEVVGHLVRLGERLTPEEMLEPSRQLFSWLGSLPFPEVVRQALAGSPVLAVPPLGILRPEQVAWDDPTGGLPSLSALWPDEWKDWFVGVVGVAENGDVEALLCFLESGAAESDREGVLRALRIVCGGFDTLRDDERDRLAAATCWPSLGTTRFLPLKELIVADQSLARRLTPSPPAVDAEFAQIAGRLGARRLTEAAARYTSLGETKDDAATARLDRLWPLVAWFIGEGAPLSPPVVARVESLEAMYHLGQYVGYAHPSPRAHFDAKENKIRVGPRAGRLPASVGDAMERGLHRSRLRELVKDLWAADDEQCPEVIQEWAEAEGLGSPPELVPLSECGLAARDGADFGDKAFVAAPSTITMPRFGGSERHRTNGRRRTAGSRTSTLRSGAVDAETRERRDQAEGQAVSIVCEWLQCFYPQAEIEDVSASYRGYDLHVTHRETGEIWHVEVKGLTASSASITLTRNERDAAAQPEWKLYVVTGLGLASGHLHRIEGSAVTGWADEDFEPLTYRVRDWARDGEVTAIDWQ